MNIGYFSHWFPDYAGDFLFAGLRTMPGVKVRDFPDKPALHWPENDPIPEGWPTACVANYQRELSFDVEQCDAVVFAAAADMQENEPYDLFRRVKPDAPLVVVDGTDGWFNWKPAYEKRLGRRVDFYLKRELPIGEKFAEPFPLSFPHRLAHRNEDRVNRVFYCASSHQGTPAADVRREIYRKLQAVPKGPYEEPEMFLTGKLAPLPVKMYRERMANSTVGIHWNGTDVWDGLRLWEGFAHEQCMVVQRPTIRIPAEPVHGVHCLYADTVDDLVDMVKWALSHPEFARRIATNGHDLFWRHHSSEARARRVMALFAIAADFEPIGDTGRRPPPIVKDAHE